MVDFNFGFLEGFGMSGIAFVVLIAFLSLGVIAIVGFAVFLFVRHKQLKIKIPLHAKVGGRIEEIETYKAMVTTISRAGDKLWYIPKLKKFLFPANLQSKANTYPHYVRPDGEWMNFIIEDIDEKLKRAKIHFIKQDMRAQRIATGDLIEKRFKNKKSFWDQWGKMIIDIMFFLIVAIAMVIIFYQFGTIVDKLGNVVARLDKIEARNKVENIVPQLTLLLFSWRHLKKKK